MMITKYWDIKPQPNTKLSSLNQFLNWKRAELIPVLSISRKIEVNYGNA